MKRSANTPRFLPYLLLLLFLLLFQALRLPAPLYALLTLPILMAAAGHGLVGGVVAGSATAILLLWRGDESLHAVALTALIVGPVAGWFMAWARRGERLRVERLEKERRDALEAIAAAGREIAASPDLTRTLGLVMQKAGETLPMDAGILFRLDEATKRYQVLVSHNLPLDTVEKISFASGEGVAGLGRATQRTADYQRRSRRHARSSPSG